MFHSRMIAWLLDPNTEHGYGDYFIKEFAKIVDSRGNISMSSAIKGGNLNVSTEKKMRKHRCDITIEVDKKRFIVENKVKSLGSDLQLEVYQGYGEVVGLGFIDVSYAESVAVNHPIIVYKDILNIIKNRPSNAQCNPYEVLIIQYQEYLENEIGIIDLMRQTYFGDNVSKDGDALSKEINIRSSCNIYNDNDIRFLNYAYLEYLRCHFDSQVRKLKWSTNKDMISGPWLSSWQGTTNGYAFNDEFTDRLEQFGVSNFWFHIQIETGVAQANATAVAGKLQLKTASSDTRAWCDELKTLYKLCSNQSWCKRISKNNFYIVEESFTRNDLHKDIMVPKIKAFMECFGKFQ
jgi:hypothetical protein